MVHHCAASRPPRLDTMRLSRILAVLVLSLHFVSSAEPLDRYQNVLSGNVTGRHSVARERVVAEDREEVRNRQKLKDDDDDSSSKLLEEFLHYGKAENASEAGYRLRYDVYDGPLRRYRYEEKTSDGLIVGEVGYHRDNGIIRGVKYTATPGVHPKLLYQTLLKFLSL